MKTVAAIKNELFKDYLKVVSTDNLEQTLDNPAVPVPFVCVAAVQNQNSETIAAEINKFFEHRKLKGKDFLAMSEEDLTQLHFLFNLVQLSGGGQVPVAAPVVSAPTPTPTPTPAPVAEKTVKVEAPAVVVEEKAEVIVEAPVVVETPVVEAVVEPVVETPAVVEEKVEEVVAETPAVEAVVEAPAVEVKEVAASSELIESLGIAKGSTIHFIKNEEVTATILDEKTVVFDGEELPIVDATKKAFKKAGVTGMALGLANWNYEGTSLKALKEKN
jgi:hypothetical protein